ncbi:MAG: LacI family DNA-binding transcriptional regulator [Puniceicoccaceae bacterium]
MDNSNKGPRRGRPPLDGTVKQAVLDLAKGMGQGRSLRWLGRETGISPGSVRRILEEAGLWKRRTRNLARGKAGKGVAKEFVNLTTVAEEAGVSKSTASLALKGSPKIREETRKRVEKAAEKLNYRAHPYVGAHMASVRSGRIRNIQEAVAYVWSGLSMTRNWDMMKGLPWGPTRTFEASREAALTKGYRIFPMAFFEYGHNTRRLGQVLYNRGVRGILLDVPAFHSSIFGMDLSKFACVAFRDQNPIDMHVVGHDVFRSILIAYARLWKLGYRRIGYYTSDAQSTSTLFARDAAFRHAQYHLTPPADRLPILHFDTIYKHFRDSVYYGERPSEINRVEECDWLLEQDWSDLKAKVAAGDPVMETIHYEVFSRWLKACQPDAMICEQGEMVDWLNKLGYGVPEDIAVVHCNLNTDVEGWSGIRRADELLGAYAIELLVQKIDHGELGLPKYPLSQRIAGQWVDGFTTRKLSKPRTPLERYAEEWIAKVVDTSSTTETLS